MHSAATKAHDARREARSAWTSGGVPCGALACHIADILSGPTSAAAHLPMSAANSTLPPPFSIDLSWQNSWPLYTVYPISTIFFVSLYFVGPKFWPKLVPRYDPLTSTESLYKDTPLRALRYSKVPPKLAEQVPCARGRYMPLRAAARPDRYLLSPAIACSSGLISAAYVAFVTCATCATCATYVA